MKRQSRAAGQVELPDKRLPGQMMKGQPGIEVSALPNAVG
jgi:hypothetical protein